ncbi:hypothetical protein EUTSA_v10015553mg [Eutrema salsugineum]|uniref:Uncharacterized protein n=1 Tax=Eutrema salsugineum TaxID=72664 RepID=V4N5E0_EUTSA|nr:hypothetical protein EUTSA_v10015553mg [Eutrema salsugineum]
MELGRRVFPAPHPLNFKAFDNAVFWNGTSRANQDSSTFLVHEMEKNSLSWSVKYNVDSEPLAVAFPEMIRTENFTNRRLYTFSVIGTVKEEMDAESYILLHIPNKTVKYSFIDKTFKKLCSFEPSFYDALSLFFESLANV